MPTYEYVCRACDEHIEVVQSFKDAALETCGLCGGTLRKVFSAAGIIFKGSGYYVTDSRKKPAEPAKSGESKSGESKSGGSSSGDKAAPSESSKGSESGSGGATAESA